MFKNRNDEVLAFLKILNENNHKDWFDANRKTYEDIREYYKKMINELIANISKFDGSVAFEDSKSSIFRINRDIRFSKDKSPYKTNFGAYIVPGGKKSSKAGYYLHLDNEGCFLAGGVYHPMPEALKRIRWAIYENTDEFLKIIEDKSFKKYFKNIDGERVSKLPREFDKEFKYPELLKFKDYNVIYSLSAEDVQRADFVDFCAGIYKYSFPLNNFINSALTEL